MKIVMLNGQNHKGSTYNIGRIIADKLCSKRKPSVGIKTRIMFNMMGMMQKKGWNSDFYGEVLLHFGAEPDCHCGEQLGGIRWFHCDNCMCY